MSADNSSDVVGVDDLSVTGEDTPLYWTGFEAASLSGDGWTTEDSPDLTTDQSEIWTDATDNGSADGKAAHMNGGSDPDDAFMRTVSTAGLQNIKVRYTRDTDDFGGSDNLVARYSTDGGTSWTNFETVTGDVSPASVVFGPLPAAANNNANFKLRFEIHANDSGDDHAYVDDVVIWGEPMPTGSISGTKFDSEGNGLADWTIWIYDGENWTDTSTDEDGEYSFEDLEDGEYTVCEEMQDGWQQLTPSEGEDCDDLGTVGQFVEVEDAEDVTGIDFTNLELGSITIVKATTPEEVDQDFSFTTNGEGLEGFTLNTAGDYAETFSNLEPGQYTVTETMVEGYDLTSIECSDNNGLVNVGTGEAVLNVDAGEDITCTYKNERLPNLNIVKYASPADSVFQIDVDMPGETPDQTFFAEVAGSGTDNSGDQFDNVQPGEYELSEVLPEGWSGVSNVACYNGDEVVEEGGTSVEVELGYGDNITCIFNNTPYSTIVGDKYEDLDGNGESTSGPGLEGWNMTLYKWTEGDGWYWDTVAINATDEGGVYSFGNILPGSYLVCEENRSGWNQSSGTGNSTACSELEGQASGGYTLTIADIPPAEGEGEDAGQTFEGYSFGNWQYGTVVGIKWNDENANGVLDEGETGLQGWNIQLTGGEVENNFTTVGGAYTFEEVAPGTYTVGEVMQEGWAQTYPTTGTHTVTVQSGSHIIRNFGNVEDSTISGSKWNDENGNAIWDDGEESPDATFTFNLYTVVGESAPVLVTSISDDSYYNFTGLLPGTYMVCEANTEGWTQTYPASGGCHTVTVSVNENSTNNNFGNAEIIELYGYKFNDLNHDGEWYTDGESQTEPGIAGWNITATPMKDVEVCNEEEESCDTERVVDTDRAVHTTVTDADGQYEFKFLPSESGWWRLSEENRMGWTQTYPENSFFDIFIEEYPHGDCEGPGYCEGAYHNYNFGNWEWPIVTIFKWKDQNGNGVRDTVSGTETLEAPVADYPVAVGRKVAVTQGEEGQPTHIDTEIVALSLTGSDGVASIPLNPEWFGGLSGLDTAIHQGLMVFEGQKTNWAKTYPNQSHTDVINLSFRSGLDSTALLTDSFFDVFTELSVDHVMNSGWIHNTESHPISLAFGNRITIACQDGIDNNNDGLIDMQDPGCGTPEDGDEGLAPASSGGGTGGGNGPVTGSFGNSAGGGQVLGAATTFSPAPGEQCSEYLSSFMGPNLKNDPDQVRRLQEILKSQGFEVAVNGEYDAATIAAVKAFQLKYADEILKPWGLTQPTGNVYITTRKKLNELYCGKTGETFPLSDDEQKIIDNFKGGGTGGGMSGSTTGTIRTSAPDTGTDTSTDTSEGTTSTDSQVGAAAGTGGGGFWSRIKSLFGF